MNASFIFFFFLKKSLSQSKTMLIRLEIYKLLWYTNEVAWLPGRSGASESEDPSSNNSSGEKTYHLSLSWLVRVCVVVIQNKHCNDCECSWLKPQFADTSFTIIFLSFHKNLMRTPCCLLKIIDIVDQTNLPSTLALPWSRATHTITTKYIIHFQFCT